MSQVPFVSQGGARDALFKNLVIIGGTNVNKDKTKTSQVGNERS